MKRTYMVGNLDNWYGNLEKLSEVMEQAEEFECEDLGRDETFTRRAAEQVAEAYAEFRYDDWEYPSNFDLIIWEFVEGDHGEPVEPSEVCRVKIQVRITPLFHDSDVQVIEVPA